MKIDGQYTKLPIQDKTVQKGKEKDVGPAEKKKATGAKQLENQFAINKLKSRIETEPDINLDKVKAIKEKLKKGEYQVDTQKLANKLIKDSLIEDI